MKPKARASPGFPSTRDRRDTLEAPDFSNWIKPTPEARDAAPRRSGWQTARELTVGAKGTGPRELAFGSKWPDQHALLLEKIKYLQSEVQQAALCSPLARVLRCG